jgi:hypothetical protein
MSSQTPHISSSQGNMQQHKTSLAHSQENEYLREMRDLRNKVRGALENADYADPANAVLLEATARMWRLKK